MNGSQNVLDQSRGAKAASTSVAWDVDSRSRGTATLRIRSILSLMPHSGTCVEWKPELNILRAVRNEVLLRQRAARVGEVPTEDV